MDRQEHFERLAFSFGLSALLLFAIPSFGAWFAGYAERYHDEAVVEDIEDFIGAEHLARAGEAQEVFEQFAPSEACSMPNASSMPTGDVCWRFTQFRVLRGASLLAGVLGLLILLTIAACTLLARGRALERFATIFVYGWAVMRLLVVPMMLARVVVFALLSYWVTMVFIGDAFDIVVVIGTGMSVVNAGATVWGVLKRPGPTNAVFGAELGRGDAPVLWERIEALCEGLDTQLPGLVVVSLGQGFFVTERPVLFNGSLTRGRMLYLGLPLLRVLTRPQADALMAHELALFSGGDQAFEGRIEHTLLSIDVSTQVVFQFVTSVASYMPMFLYLNAFEVLIEAQEDARVARADRSAAVSVSPDDLAHALVREASYAAYWKWAKQSFTEQLEQDATTLLSRESIDAYSVYVRGASVVEELERADASERVVELGKVPLEAYSSFLSELPDASWCDDIEGSMALEEQLWLEYMRGHFTRGVRSSLAYQYAPNTPEERRVVEEQFPPIRLANKKTGEANALVLDCLQLHYEEWEEPIDLFAVTKVGNTLGLRGFMVRIRYEGGFGTKAHRDIHCEHLEMEDLEILQTIQRYVDRVSKVKALQVQGN